MLVFDLPSLPVRVQGHQGLLPAAEGHHARADQGQVPAGQAARPRRPHGRHAGVQQRGLPARALRATSWSPSCKHFCAEPARGRRRRAGDPPRLHRAAHDPAQHLPARRDARADRARRDRVRQRDQGPGGAPTSSPATCCGRTSASRATARWCSTTTTRSSTSPTATSARCPTPRNEEEEMSRRGLVPRRPEGRVPRDLRALPARQPGGARGLHEAPRRPARRRFWQGHKERILAGHVHDVFPYDARTSASERASAGAARGCRLRRQPRHDLHLDTTKEPHHGPDSIVIVSAARTPIGGLLGRLFSARRAASSAPSRSRPRSSAPACPATPSTKC